MESSLWEFSSYENPGSPRGLPTLKPLYWKDGSHPLSSMSVGKKRRKCQWRVVWRVPPSFYWSCLNGGKRKIFCFRGPRMPECCGEKWGWEWEWELRKCTWHLLSDLTSHDAKGMGPTSERLERRRIPSSSSLPLFHFGWVLHRQTHTEHSPRCKRSQSTPHPLTATGCEKQRDAKVTFKKVNLHYHHSRWLDL